jgi:hypothetical protein
LPLFHGQEQHVGLLKDLHSVEEKKRVGEPEGVSDPIEASGASSGPILRPRTSRASQPAVDEIVQEEEEERHETSSDDNESEENYRM